MAGNGVTKIRVLAARAIATVLEVTGQEFERQSGYRLNLECGFGPDFIRRIHAGVPFDFIAVPGPMIDRLVNDGMVIASTRTDLVRSGTGVAVRAGSPIPDVGSVAAFKRALLDAESIGYLKLGGVPELVARLGLAEAIRDKVTMPDTDIVSELVAQGALELGIVVMTQILTTPGVRLAGPLPDEIQLFLVFSGATSSTSKVSHAVGELIKFLKGPLASSVAKKQRMEPL